jgi:hypothetical protein
MDNIHVHVEFEKEDTLAVLLKRIRLEGAASAPLKHQAKTIVEQVTYLDGELAVIEIDGIANAVQIRSRKPVDGRFVEIILRGGNTIKRNPKAPRNAPPVH